MEAVLNTLAAPTRALLVSVGVSAGLLAGAHAFERIGGMTPCLLCLDQREVHWTALFVAGAMLVFANRGAKRVVAAGLGALTLVYLFSTGLAAYHAGVEWGFWEGPAGCAATAIEATPSIDDLLSSLDGPGAAGPACSEAAWRVLGISMAGYNALVSMMLASVCAFACALFARRRRVDGRLLAA